MENFPKEEKLMNATAIDERLVSKMKELTKLAKENNKILPSSEAFKKYPPEGTWFKDKDGNITIREN